MTPQAPNPTNVTNTNVQFRPISHHYLQPESPLQPPSMANYTASNQTTRPPALNPWTAHRQPNPEPPQDPEAETHIPTEALTGSPKKWLRWP